MKVSADVFTNLQSAWTPLHIETSSYAISLVDFSAQPREYRHSAIGKALSRNSVQHPEGGAGVAGRERAAQRRPGGSSASILL